MIRRAAVACVLLAACSGATATSTTVGPPTTAGDPPPGDIFDQLSSFEINEIGLGDETWVVAVADTSELRARGLMGVADLGALDGMLFVFPTDTTSRFWMFGTAMPIDIAFFTAEGGLVGDVISMTPCDPGPDGCPTYGVDQPYRYAVETEAGGFEGLELRLQVDP